MSPPDDGIGAPLLRREDRRFLTGRGRFLDDIALPGALWCAFVRSPHAHARFGPIDTAPADAMPGVAAVLTGADMATDDIGPMRCAWPIKWADGTDMPEPPRWALAREVVRHVGEPVAVVIADRRDAARDAAEAIAVDWQDLPAVTDAPTALTDGAPTLHPEAPGNVCFRFKRGDKAATDAAFAAAAETVRLDLVNHRLACAAIEPRATAARWDPDRRSLTLYTTTQTPHLIRRAVAEQLGLPEGDLRVISPDVGGGFGMKGKHYPEETVVAWAARKLGQPVRWTGDRSEAFVTDTQARDHHSHVELALATDGAYLGLRVKTVANIGAYVSTYGAAIPSAIYSGLLAGVYATPAIDIEITGVFTNSVPTDAYRGAGRPEACYVLERITDAAAAKLGIDRVELRRRNMIPASAMPYTTPIGPTYDLGDFPRILDGAAKAAGYAGFAARRDRAPNDGKLRGIGVAAFVESSGVAPSRIAGAMGARGGLFESAEIRVDASGGVTLALGTHNHGQGHETSFAQIVADRLGVPVARVTVVEGDTAAVPMGTGTFGSRSIAVGGSATVRATHKIAEKGRRIAAHLLEADAEDVIFEGGVFSVAGTDKTVSFFDVARAANIPHDYPLEELEPGLQETAFYDPVNFAYSNGVHVCEVEVDPETGVVTLGRLLDGRRHRHGDQSHHRRGSGPWRPRPGHRPGADGARPLRRRDRPAGRRLVHGLRRAPRRRPDPLRHRHRREPALHPQPARRQGLRRIRHDRRARRCGLRRLGCAAAAGRHRHRHAADPRARVASDPRRTRLTHLSPKARGGREHRILPSLYP